MTQTFTLRQAQSALVFVKPILKDIQSRLKKIMELKKNDPENEVEIAKHLEKIKHFIEELEQVGCVCKSLERGIVDFPTYYKSKAAYLCWHHEEDTIRYWHTINDGFESRRLIDDEFVHFNSAQADLSTVPRQN